jgi:hypothetical protein
LFLPRVNASGAENEIVSSTGGGRQPTTRGRARGRARGRRRSETIGERLVNGLVFERVV